MKLDKDLAEISLELKEYLLVNKSFVPEDELKAKLDELVELDLNLEELFPNSKIIRITFNPSSSP